MATPIVGVHSTLLDLQLRRDTPRHASRSRPLVILECTQVIAPRGRSTGTCLGSRWVAAGVEAVGMAGGEGWNHSS
jgi:hypothetical protein